MAEPNDTKKRLQYLGIAVAISLVLLFATAYIEKAFFDKSLLFTYVSYCLYTCLYTMFIFEKQGDFFIRSLLTLALFGICMVLAFFIIAFRIDNTIIATGILFFIYVAGLAVSFCKIYETRFSFTLLIELTLAAAVTLAVIYSIGSFNYYNYGFSLLCALWSLTIISISLKRYKPG